MRSCPRTYGLEILSRKWSYFTMRTLQTPKTFSELLKDLRFVTNHTLSRELKLLQEEGVVLSHDGEYGLTPAGVALLAAAEPLHQWAFKHRGMQFCPPELSCSRCARYEEVIGP